MKFMTTNLLYLMFCKMLGFSNYRSITLVYDNIEFHRRLYESTWPTDCNTVFVNLISRNVILCSLNVTRNFFLSARTLWYLIPVYSVLRKIT